MNELLANTESQRSQNFPVLYDLTTSRDLINTGILYEFGSLQKSTFFVAV